MPEEINNSNDDQEIDQSLSPEGDEDNIVDEAIEGDGEGTDASQGKDVGLKDKLGQALGKEFPDDKTALKAVKDTFNYVGEIKNIKELKSVMGQLQGIFNTDQKGVLNKIDEIAKTEGTGKVDPTKFVSKSEYDRSNFYLNNPDYKPYIRLVEVYQKANPDKSRQEIVEMDDFKEDFTKIKAHDEAEGSKSVLRSSPRLGKATDKLSEAREAQGKGDQSIAEQKAVEAVVDAYPVEPKK